jgi:large subunit ribosomal protein L25
MHEKAPILTAKHRDRLGSRYCQRLRTKGELPAVVYGRGKEPVPITLNMRDAIGQISKGEKVFRLDFPGVKDTDEGQMVLLRDLQFDYLGTNIVHVDLARVSLTDRVRTSVPIHLLGEAKGLKQAGAILMHPVAEIAVECPVQEIPEFIEVRIEDLDVGHAVTAGDVKLPTDNFKLITDSHAMVAQIVIQQEIKVGEAVATDATAGPEVITAKKPEEGAAGAAAGAKAPAAGAAKAPAAGAAAKPAAGGAAKPAGGGAAKK